MLDHLHRMAVFQAVMDAGSFRGAAKALGLSPSVVSHHVSQLEDQLGFALIYRSTRRISLTDAGAELLESTRRMTRAAEDGLSAMSRRQSNPTGRLKVASPSGGSHAPSIGIMEEFVKLYPGIHLTIDYGDSFVDLEGSGYDVALRGGFTQLKDSSYKSRRVFSDEVWLTASAAKVAEMGMPQTLYDLEGWDWIEYPKTALISAFLSDAPDDLPSMNTRVTLDSFGAALSMNLAGVGIVATIRSAVIRDVNAGRLLRLLPDVELIPIEVYAVWPANVGRDSLVHLLVDHVAARMQAAIEDV